MRVELMRERKGKEWKQEWFNVYRQRWFIRFAFEQKVL